MDDPHPLDLNATLKRLETGVSPVPVEIALTSIAISLKQIAEMLSYMHAMQSNTNMQLMNLSNKLGEVNQAIHLNRR